MLERFLKIIDNARAKAAQKKVATKSNRDAIQWYRDRYASVALQRNLLLGIVFISLAAVIVASTAIIKVTSLKTVEPFIIEIEKESGVTTVVDPQSINEFQANDLINRYFIVKYVMARESYTAMDYKFNYGQVAQLMSTVSVYEGFKLSLSSNNPRSPFLLPAGASRKVQIRSITFLTKDTAQVRLTTSDALDVRPGKTTEKDRVAVLQFEYKPDEQLPWKERFINPLGFKVTSYRIDDEIGTNRN